MPSQENINTLMHAQVNFLSFKLLNEELACSIIINSNVHGLLTGEVSGLSIDQTASYLSILFL